MDYDFFKVDMDFLGLILIMIVFFRGYSVARALARMVVGAGVVAGVWLDDKDDILTYDKARDRGSQAQQGQHRCPRECKVVGGTPPEAQRLHHTHRSGQLIKHL